MAQNQLTVTNSNPTPPTNLVNSGSPPPNPATFDPQIYVNTGTGLDGLGLPYYPRANLAPYYDDSIANTYPVISQNEGGGVNGTTAPSLVGNGKVFAAKKAALAVGGTSADHEGLGTEVAVTATVPNPSPHGQLVMVSTGPVLTAASIAAGPNASHASSDSATPTSAPTITGLLPVAPVGNGGTTPLTVNGTNFKAGAVVNIAGVPYPTQYNSATQLVVMNAPKRTSAGNTAITVRVGATTPAGTNWVFS